MIESRIARQYLERRVAEHELGVPNGEDMDPDVVALSAIVLAIDARLEEVLSRLDRRCCAWAGPVVEAVLSNKGALAAILAAVAAVLAAVVDRFTHVFGG